MKYNIAAQPYYYWWTQPTHIASKKWHYTSQLYQLSSEKKMLHCQLCSTCYTAVWINKLFKRTSAIKVVTRKITDNFHCEWYPKRYLSGDVKQWKKQTHIPTIAKLHLSESQVFVSSHISIWLHLFFNCCNSLLIVFTHSTSWPSSEGEPSSLVWW